MIGKITSAGSSTAECDVCPKDQIPNADQTGCVCKDPNATFVPKSVANGSFVIGDCIPKK